MKYGVIGSGVVGRTLAAGLKRHRHEVRIASRTPAKLEAFVSAEGITAGLPDDVAAWCDAAVLAVDGNGAVNAIHEAGAAHLSEKLVIDVTNPIAKEPPEDGVIKYFTGPNESLLERLQAAFPGVRFVKAFNIVGHAVMVNPTYAGGPPTMFYCGNDAEAKAAVNALLVDFGWEPVDLGTAKAARAIESLAQLWCIPGFLNGSWTHAFKLLRQ